MPARSPPSPLYIRNGAVERTLTTRLLSAISPREIRTRHPALGAHHKQQLERVEILPRHICNHLSAYVSIRQHSSAFVSVHLHTSAYVSVHLHTSAYVSSSWNALEFCVGILPRHICKHLDVVKREDRRSVKSRAPASEKNAFYTKMTRLKINGCVPPCHAAPQVSVFVLLCAGNASKVTTSPRRNA